jgi:tRNA(Met) cytidine acetyltransferase
VGEVKVPGIQNTDNLEVRHWLGRELALLVYDCWQGLDPNALAAICGCIRGGGHLLLLTPELAAWPGWADPCRERIGVGGHNTSSGFLSRFAGLLQTAPEAKILRPGDAFCVERAHWTQGKAPQLTFDQAAGLAAISTLIKTSGHPPLLITADRGRGKSSLLGHAAAALLQQGLGPILATAAHPQMLDGLFTEARRCLPDAPPQRFGTLRLDWQGQSLSFVPADELLRQRHGCRLLLVDEAAALPLPLLEALVKDYPGVVFASTTHGYEGSGRGFVLRFGQRLDVLRPGWRQMELTTAVRWAKNDPLERLLYRLLLLDAEPDAPPRTPGSRRIEQLTAEALTANEPLLRQVFGLLRATHYQTRPADLRRLLDQPDLVILVMMEQVVVIGVLLAGVEGGVDPELASQIQLGLRRPRGHLLPQSLSTHAGLEGAAEFKYLRVSRIAIHPDRQRQGLGSQLLQCLATSSPEVDFLGASFAASPELIAFWYRNDCWPLRLGYRREAASGQHSLQLLKPLSKTALGVWPQWRQRFDEQFPYLLGDPLRHLEPGIAALLLYPQGGARPLDAQDRADLHAFTQGRRDYGGARLALWRLLCLCAHRSDAARIEALILKVLQAHEWHSCAQRLGLAGRKAVLERMRQEARELLKAVPPHTTGC